MSTNIFTKVFNSKKGWYRGDFHVHTTSSDGFYAPSLTAELAQAEGLDFLAITDHNTIAGLSQLKKDLGILVIPGIEITLDKGHFNVFGMDDWRDWMGCVGVSEKGFTLSDKYQTMTELMQEISAEGLLKSINHPHLYPWEWLYKDTDLRLVNCLELWNDLYYPGNVEANPQAVAMWTKWLNAGHRITAIGGSDYHHPPRPEENIPGERLGYPSTYVYAETLSMAGILEGVKNRRVYVSKGPQVSFEAKVQGQIYGIGAEIGETKGEIEFSATVSSGPKSAQAQLVSNGAVLETKSVNGGKSQLQFKHQAAPSQAGWYRLDVVDSDGQALAITNPIFVGPRREPDICMYEDFGDNLE